MARPTYHESPYIASVWMSSQSLSARATDGEGCSIARSLSQERRKVRPTTVEAPPLLLLRATRPRRALQPCPTALSIYLRHRQNSTPLAGRSASRLMWDAWRVRYRSTFAARAATSTVARRRPKSVGMDSTTSLRWRTGTAVAAASHYGTLYALSSRQSLGWQVA